ncbi:hypothetical protein BJX99DRAFT_252324 [Aspergillus californicus]
MDAITAYGVAAGGCILLIILFRIIFSSRVSMLVAYYLTYRFVIKRSRFAGPWTRAGFISYFVYLIINLLVLALKSRSLVDAARGAGELSLINMTILYTGSPLSFMADWLGVSIYTYRRIHQAAAWMSGSLMAFHVVVLLFIKWDDFKPGDFDTIFAIIGAGAIVLILLLSLPFVRDLAFDAFLLGHQGLAGLFIYAMWQHLPSNSGPRILIYIMIAVYSLTFIWQLFHAIYRNGILPTRYPMNIGPDRIETVPKLSPSFVMRAQLSRPIKVDPGQYVYLRFPGLGLWSWMQSHPFVVTSWSDQAQSELEFYVQSRQGETANLLRYLSKGGGATVSLRGLINGPHGVSKPVEQYETIVAIASDSGIAALIPYLRKVVFGYSTSPTHVRQVFVIWHITSGGAFAMQEDLNELLNDDLAEENDLLKFHLFIENGQYKESFSPRAMTYPEAPDYRAILDDYLSKEYIEKTKLDSSTRKELKKDLEKGEKKKGGTIVMVSASTSVRETVRLVVHDYLNRDVQMLELEYQPPDE